MNNYEKRLFLNYFEKMIDDISFNYYSFENLFEFFIDEFGVDRKIFNHNKDGELLLKTHVQINFFKKKINESFS